jgi:hypothetical protein
MKRTVTVTVYLTDEENEKLRSYMSQNTNGYNPSVSTFIRSIIFKHINTQPLSTPPVPPSNKPNIESSQHLNLSDLDW